MTLAPAPVHTAGQQLALTQLQSIAAAGDAVRVLAVRPATTPGGPAQADLSLDCSDLPRTQAGLTLRRREQITVDIPAAFPYAAPLVRTRHTRFADAPHVNWGRYLCMYRSPSTEFDPADGMYGFVTRVLDWFQAAAAGELDGPGEAIHPPFAMPDPEAGLLVIRRDAPVADPGRPWLGAAVLHRVREDRADVVGWLPLADPWPTSSAQARAAAGLPTGAEVFLAPAIVTTRHLTFNYPDNAQELIQALIRDDLSAVHILGLLSFTAEHNRTTLLPTADPDDDTAVVSLYVVLGTPSRGITGTAQRQTHLVAWKLPDFGDTIAELTINAFDQDTRLAELGAKAMELGTNWLRTLPTRWARVDEARPEVTVRRDTGTPASWLRGKHILVIGSGALGAPIAEMCVRGGAARVVAADRAAVHPGILTRQPYTDADIGHAKAVVLTQRLRQIAPGTTVVDPLIGDIATTLPVIGPHTFDLILDCTADRIVRARLEADRATAAEPWPHLATVMIGHQATRGIAALSPAGTTGGGLDVLRRTALAARADATGTLVDIVDDFFPAQPRTQLFQPEPGCSDATFTGSAADVTGLAGQLMTGILHALSDTTRPATMSALIVRMPTGPNDPPTGGSRWLTWPDDTVLTDTGRHQIRISPAALAEMRTEARRGARVRGPRVETGGTLLGAIDDATGIIWIDEATGPPPDSLLSEPHFQHGLTGTSEHLAARRHATGGTTRFLGMWHTHPHGPARPSPTDTAGMADLTVPVDGAPPRALILIAGGPTDRWHNWLEAAQPPHWYAALVDRNSTTPSRPHPDRPDLRPLGPITWWPGGYATHALTTPPQQPGTRP